MAIKSMGGRFRIFPDNNARVLAQWAAAGYPVIRQDDPRSVRRIASKTMYSKEELHRTVRGGEHRLASFLRTD